MQRGIGEERRATKIIEVRLWCKDIEDVESSHRDLDCSPL